MALARWFDCREAVVCNSCTNAIQLALMWERRIKGPVEVSLPRRTYVGVAHAVLNAGHWLAFRDEDWLGAYRLDGTRVIDSARRFSADMYLPDTMQCVSFHVSKICGATQGGAILLDDAVAAEFMRRARFDGRGQGIAPIDDIFNQPAMHCYLSPSDAAQILWKLSTLRRDSPDLPNDNYPDLSTHSWFARQSLV
jgi:dTDP-4-amino-4,6-dideoxygalactose transaminase